MVSSEAIRLYKGSDMMYNTLDIIDFEIEQLYQQWKTEENEDTKKYLFQLMEDKQKEYKEIEKQLEKQLEEQWGWY